MSPRRVARLVFSLAAVGFVACVGSFGGWRGLRELAIAVACAVGFLGVLLLGLALSHALQHDRWPWDDDWGGE